MCRFEHCSAWQSYGLLLIMIFWCFHAPISSCQMNILKRNSKQTSYSTGWTYQLENQHLVINTNYQLKQLKGAGGCEWTTKLSSVTIKLSWPMTAVHLSWMFIEKLHSGSLIFHVACGYRTWFKLKIDLPLEAELDVDKASKRVPLLVYARFGKVLSDPSENLCFTLCFIYLRFRTQSCFLK